MPVAELILDCRNTHGEGVLWDAHSHRVWWTDIHGKKLWSLDPTSGASASFEVPARICCFAPRARGGLLVAFAEGFAFYDLSSRTREDLALFEPELPCTRLNDGRTDRAGRFVAGGMDEANGQPVSSVWRVDGDSIHDPPLRRRRLRQRDLLFARRPDHVLRRLAPPHHRGHRL